MKTRTTIQLKFPAESYGYKIEIGNDIFKEAAGSIKKQFPGRNALIFSDSKVSKLYASKLKQLLIEQSVKTEIITFPYGEKSKSAEIKEKVESSMIKRGVDRSAFLIALGGGVTGDLGGYIAATYMRGIPFIQIPTSLLAMVDSSIGGKVAIDHPLGKNMIGVFYQPKAVFIDISTLKTLPVKEFFNGISEVIKSALIYDRNFFNYIVRFRNEIIALSDIHITKIITESCRIKSQIVMLDEKEAGLRKLLNYGHTIGHAIEILSEFSLPHGYCVAIGMNAENKIAYKMGLLSFDDYKKVNEILSFFHLRSKIPSKIKPKDILKKIKIDKKSVNGIPYFTLLKGIGVGCINQVVDEKLIMETLEEMR